jgi:predicted dehydrogenase
MRRNARKAQDFAARHGARRWYTDAAALVDDPEVNAVYIASPHNLHREHVTLAARAHKRILCEKPMGTSAADAQAIVDVCRENGASLTVAYYRRFWYITRAIQRLLRDRAIGQIVQARVQLCDNFMNDPERAWVNSRAQSGGGVLANAGSHWIDLLRFFLGEFQEASAYCVPDLHGDAVDRIVGAQLRSVDGALVTVILNSVSPVSMNELEILGTGGRILGSPYSEGRYLLERPNRQPEPVQFSNFGPSHTELIGELVRRLQVGEPSPIPGEEAVAVWKIMEAIYRACEQGGPVQVAQ